MTQRIVFLCMGGVGHVRSLLQVVAGLHARGCTVNVMTGRSFQSAVERVGARFIDLYAGRSLDSIDATSMPLPTRFVSFAAAATESVAAEIAELSPTLLVYDAFAVVAPLAARLLGLPYVSMITNHAPVPARMIAALQRDPRVAISARCQAACRRLEQDFGVAGAHPFSYYDTVSPHLNLYAEPPELLTEEERRAFEPIAFFGRVAAHDGTGSSAFAAAKPGRLRVYVSFGTGVWRYFEREALAALGSISATLAELDVEAVLSLGGHSPTGGVPKSLRHANVEVADFVDQRATLADCDVFLTHHGASSTHEAIFHRVPMISYPFFGDQPALARRCQELGLAVPLTETTRAPITGEALRAALEHLNHERDAVAARLDRAREWELATTAGREAVFDRMLSLSTGSLP